MQLRFIVTGANSEGRSAVLREETIETGSGSGSSTPLWSTSEAPPQINRPDGGPAYDPGCPAGTTAWRIWELQANSEIALHRTNTLDHDTVLKGALTLLLESGEVELGEGDSVVIPDVLHGWRTGDQGVVASVMLIGLEPR
jgi:hypothetical protein